MQDNVLDEELCYLGGTAFGQRLCLGVVDDVVSSYNVLFRNSMSGMVPVGPCRFAGMASKVARWAAKVQLA